MTHEKSCGCIVFKKQDDTFKYLFLKHIDTHGGHWDLPKGHVDPGETEVETAIRETYEEAGLQVTPLPGFREMITYSPKPGVIKDVIFFIAKDSGEPVRYLWKEHDDHLWLTLEEALLKTTYERPRELIKKAEHFLRNQETLL